MTDDMTEGLLMRALMSDDFVFVDGQGTYLDEMEASRAAELLLPTVHKLQAGALREAADEMLARAMEHRKHADLLANSDRPAIRDSDDQYNQAETLKYESEMLRARADRIEQGGDQ